MVLLLLSFRLLLQLPIRKTAVERHLVLWGSLRSLLTHFIVWSTAQLALVLVLDVYVQDLVVLYHRLLRRVLICGFVQSSKRETALLDVAGVVGYICRLGSTI